MGLVGHFPENDVFIYFRWLTQDFSRSVNSFELSRIFPDTLYHNGSDGESLSSVASLQLENLRTKGRNMQPASGQMPKVMIFMIFRPSPARFKPDFSLTLRQRAMFKVTRRAFNL